MQPSSAALPFPEHTAMLKGGMCLLPLLLCKLAHLKPLHLRMPPIHNVVDNASMAPFVMMRMTCHQTNVFISLYTIETVEVSFLPSFPSDRSYLSLHQKPTHHVSGQVQVLCRWSLESFTYHSSSTTHKETEAKASGSINPLSPNRLLTPSMLHITWIPRFVDGGLEVEGHVNDRTTSFSYGESIPAR